MVADPDPFDTDKVPDPAFYFDNDPDPDPAFQFDTNLDLTVWYGYGFISLPFQRGNVPKTVLFIHLCLIFLVSRSNKTQTKGILSYIFPSS
jgi:hypothetical protein